MNQALIFYGTWWLSVGTLVWFCVDGKGRRTAIQAGAGVLLGSCSSFFWRALRNPQDEWGHVYVGFGMLLAVGSALALAAASRFAPIGRATNWRWWLGPVVATVEFGILRLLNR